MKRAILMALLCMTFSQAFSQGLTREQKYFYTCKVFGFVKYYHSGVSTCSINWDSVLVSVLPGIDSATTVTGFNDWLDTMLQAAGPMTLATTPPPAVLPPDQRRNLNFGWINDSATLRADIRTVLDTIKNNFRPHAECWVKDNDYTTSYGGWLVFPHDNPQLDVNTATSFPDRDHKLLLLFKYWNVVNYFSPNNHIIAHPWDSTLYHYCLQVADAANPKALYFALERLTSELNDAHTEGLTWSQHYFQPPGWYSPMIRLRYTEGQYVVIKSQVSGINPGDALVTVDGMSTHDWEDSLRPYISAGNDAVFRRFMSQAILSRDNPSTVVHLTVEDGSGTYHNFGVAANVNPYSSQPFFYGNYYPNDSLNSIFWTTMQCDIGYVNMGNIKDSNVAQMYSDLQSKSTIIFDIRNYPNGTAWSIADLIYPNRRNFSNDLAPDVTYPGTFYWYRDSLGNMANPTPYMGKIILLINEETQSQAEYSCMIFEAMPNVVKVGTQTAGADGNISYWDLTQDIQTGFSTIGIYYPDGTNAQRLGIVPDSIVEITRNGIKDKRDYVLEKALTMAGCKLEVPDLAGSRPEFIVFPNPASELVSIEGSGAGNARCTLTLTDIAGKVLRVQQIMPQAGGFRTTVDLSDFSSGMYLLRLNGDAIDMTKKLTKF